MAELLAEIPSGGTVDTDGFIRAVRDPHPALLVVDANAAFATGPRLASLRRNVACPLPVIRR